MNYRLRALHRLSISAAAVLVTPIVALLCAQAVAQTPPKSPEAPDIVVIGRRLRSITPKDVTDTVPPTTIKAYGEDSIGALLNRLTARFGRNFSIVVNGRRLASTDAIDALPPEALARIEVLKGPKAAEYGFAPSEAVVNLALRPKFQSTSLEGGATGTTEGGGNTETGAMRYSRIRNDNRLNLALVYNRQSGLLRSDRIAAGTTDPAAPLYSLMPRQDLVTLTSGYAMPLGALNMDLSAEAGAVQSTTRTGPILAARSAFDLSRQRSDTRYIRSGATLSGDIAPFFWSVLVNGEANRTSISNVRGGASAIGAADLGQDFVPTVLPSDTRTFDHSFGVTTTLNGRLFTLPAGPVTFDTTSSVRQGSLTSITESAPSSRTTTLYKTLTTHGGINVPIAQRGAGRLGWLGDLNLHGGIDYSAFSRVGSAGGTSSSFEWTPFAGLLISASHSTAPSLPSATQRNAPVVARSGVLIYDAVTNRVVSVTVLTGGRDDVRETRSSSSTALVSYQTNTPLANISGSLSYTVGRTTDPLLSFSTPSPLAQALLPNLFLRAADGTLLQFDSRPFNALNEITRQLSTTLHLNGPGSPRPSAGTQGDLTIGVTPPRHLLIWDLNLSYAYMLSHRLRLPEAGGRIDLLATPLSLAGVGAARHHIGLQWTLAKPGYGLNGSITWDSGALVRSIDAASAATTRYSAVTKINIEGFVELDRAKGEADPRSLRLKIGIDNILNQRLLVTGYPGLDARSQQFLTDPYGRTMRITVRKSL